MSTLAEPRPAIATDLRGLAVLENACFQEPWSAEMLATCLEVPHLMVRVIEEAPHSPMAEPPVADSPAVESLAAAAIVQCAGAEEAELLRLCSHPDRRRAGHARRLLAHLLDELAQRRVHSLFLEVRPSNVPALGLYRDGFGFEQVGRRRAYYSDGSDALVLRREL